MSARDLVAQLAAAGIPPELLASVAQELFDGERERAALAERRKNERERKAKSRDVTGQDVTGAEVTPAPCPLDPPLKSTPDPEKITPPISPKPTTELRARRLPVDWQPEPVIGKAADMLARWPPGEVERELAKFRNYWLAKAGKDACKTNWQRTWINWLISADERKPSNGGSTNGLGRNQPNDGLSATTRAARDVFGLGASH